jgi:DNA-binding GntR family transcriptional regulator
MQASQRSAGRIATNVYEELRERLVSGSYPQGFRLSVESLRSEFEVSKQPVMEALRVLSADGLVEIIPQVGCLTMSYSAQEVADFYDMFAGFEGAIAAAAALRRAEPQLLDLAAVSDMIGVLRTEPDPAVRASAYRELNRELHAVIHRMARSRIMAETSRRMWDLSDYLINSAGVKHPLASVTAERHDEHEAIRRAIESGDPEAARREMMRHIADTVGVIRAETV